MKLLNRCKKYRDKSVQLMTTSIITSHTHVPLQLCIVALNHITITCNDTVGDYNCQCYEATIHVVVVHGCG